MVVSKLVQSTVPRSRGEENSDPDLQALGSGRRDRHGVSTRLQELPGTGGGS